MSALDEIILSKKYRQSYTLLESVLMVHKKRYPNDAESAAAELLALRERVEKMELAIINALNPGEPKALEILEAALKSQ